MRGAMLISVLVTGAAVVAGALGVFGHALLVRRRRRRDERVIAPARFELLDALDPFHPAAAAAALRGLHPRERARLIVELAPVMQGDSRARLGQVASEVGTVLVAERDLRSRRWPRRLLGARVLTVLGLEDPLMRAALGDRSVPVRAQAAEWATDHPDREIVDRLVTLLSDPVPLVRFSAHDALARIGWPAVDTLLARFSTLQPMGRAEALAIATSLPDPRFETAALRAATDADPRIRARALGLLCALASPASASIVLDRLADPDPGVRAAATRAATVVEPREALRRLPAMLRDPAFEVRRAAARSLRSAGAAGTLLLRRALEDEDRFAAEMARQVLDAPEELLQR